MNPCRSCGVTDRYADGRCAPCARARNARWKADNREKHIAGSVRWAAANLERSRELARQYAARNRSVVNQRAKAWRAANPARHALHQQTRRAAKNASPGSFTHREWASLCESFGHRCAACGTDAKLTIDHVVPLSKGGSNLIGNIQPLCGPCNSSKGAQIIDYRGAAQ